MRRSVSAVVIVGAGLLVAAWTGHAAAAAGESGWWVEPEMGSSFDYAAPSAEELHAAGAVETGRLPSGGETAIWVEEAMGSSYDYLPDRAD